MEKAESVLGSLSVEYSDISDIEGQLDSIIYQLREVDWNKLKTPEKADIFSRCITNIWKIHPFREGNTRTIVTFCCDFADSNKFPLARKLFSDNSTYVRTALVAASAVFRDLGDRAKPEYLVKIVHDAIARGSKNIRH